MLAYDPETGSFTRIQRGRGLSFKKPPGNKRSDGYIAIAVLGQLHRAHRLAWLIMTGAWPDGELDHKDGNPSNNRWANLRDVNHQGNMQNRRKASKANKSCGLLGVTKVNGKEEWAARINAPWGKPMHLGYFYTPEAAHEAYLHAKRVLHPTCTI